MMKHYESLAMSSVRASQMGPELLMVISSFVIYHIGMTKALNLIDRHEYVPEDYKIGGVIWISFFCSSIGAVIGYGVFKQTSSIITYALGFCGATSFLTSALFIGFRLPHRIMIGLAAPVILVLSALGGRAIHLLVVKFIF